MGVKLSTKKMGGQFGRKWEKYLTALNHNASALSTNETKMATPTSKWLILMILEKIGDCESLLSVLSLANVEQVWR